MKICEICGKSDGIIHDSPKFGKILCEKHYSQFKQYGKSLDRTKFDPNEFIVNDNILEIVLYDADNKPMCKAIVDIKDYELVSKFKWCTSRGYVVSGSRGTRTLLHRLITSAPDNMVVDHINHNILDNRSSNLRVCTNRENCCNTLLQSDNTSGYKGVVKHKPNGKWIAQITSNGKAMNLGYYVDINDAIAARKAAEEKYFGEFAYKEESQGIPMPNNETL